VAKSCHGAVFVYKLARESKVCAAIGTGGVGRGEGHLVEALGALDQHAEENVAGGKTVGREVEREIARAGLVRFDGCGFESRGVGA